MKIRIHTEIYTYWIILMARIGPRIPLVNLLKISKYIIFMKRLMTSSFQMRKKTNSNQNKEIDVDIDI